MTLPGYYGLPWKLCFGSPAFWNKAGETVEEPWLWHTSFQMCSPGRFADSVWHLVTFCHQMKSFLFAQTLFYSLVFIISFHLAFSACLFQYVVFDMIYYFKFMFAPLGGISQEKWITNVPNKYERCSFAPSFWLRFALLLILNGSF